MTETLLHDQLVFLHLRVGSPGSFRLLCEKDIDSTQAWQILSFSAFSKKSKWQRIMRSRGCPICLNHPDLPLLYLGELP